MDGVDLVALQGILGGAGDEEDAHLVPPVAQHFGKLHAIDARHLDVQEQQIKGAAALLQGRIQRLGGGVGGHLPGDAPLLEDFPAKAFQALALPGVIGAPWGHPRRWPSGMVPKASPLSAHNANLCQL